MSIDDTQAAVRRSLVMLAAGALAGLGLAGYALFTARTTSTLHVPAEDVALVNQKPLSRSDFIIQLNTLYGVDLTQATAAQRTQVLDDMIREELLVQRAEELDLAATDPEVRAALVNAVEMEIAATAITEQPSEQSLRRFYETHRERYASEGVMTVRDFVFKENDPADAARAVALWKRSAPDSVAAAGLHATQAPQSGDEQFYFAAKIHLGEPLFETAARLADGEVSAPLRAGDSLHVLYMVSNRRPVPYDFDTARAQVSTDYGAESVAHLRVGEEAFLRKRANIQIADDLQ